MTTHPPAFPSLAEALDHWRRADEAFARARSLGERGGAMRDQLQARGAIYRLSEFETLLTHPLRALLVEEGVWTPRDALDRLDVVDFTVRANALRALAPVLPDDCLGRALDMATRPCWGDDTRWKADEELLRLLNARMQCERPHEYKPGRTQEPPPAESTEPDRTAESAADALASILFGTRASGQDLWTEPWFRMMLSYVERTRYVDHDDSWRHAFALVAELTRDREKLLCTRLRCALLNSGHELWAEPWFRRVFNAEERREHLRRVIADRESIRVPWSDRFEGLLQIARRLHGALRATVLQWAAAEREKGRSSEMTVDLARVAALAEGQERDAIVARIKPQLEEADTEDRLTAIVMLMPGASAAEAIFLVRCGLEALASGEAQVQDAKALLASIPPDLWSRLGRTDWEPALQAGSSCPNGWAGHLRWNPYDIGLLAVPNLPREVRDLVEVRGLPVLLGEDADDRLRIGAQSIHALSSAGRAQLTASVLALDAATWRDTSSAVGPIARALDDEDLERLCRTLHDPDPKAGWSAERGLAKAWATRGRLDRATAIVERITDDDERAKAQVEVAVAAGEVVALPPTLDPRVVYLALDHTANELVRWTPQERGPAFANALAARLNDGSAASACLRIWAALWPALSASMRENLAPRIERAVEVVLAEDDRNDDSLCAIAEHLPERLLERIWSVRASASAYRHALALYENRFCELMLAGEYHHTCVLYFVQTLGGDEALIEHARWLSGIDAGEAETGV